MPSDPARAETLPELLAALERSGNLRSLARECGLTVKELRRRLEGWRRELLADPGAAGAPRARPEAAGGGEREALLSLPAAALLRESPLPALGSRVLEAWTDGASRGNPGPAAIGVLFRQQGGPDLCTHRATIGRVTNNVAEYRAALRALEFARDWGVERLELCLDSELIVRQLNGVYQVKSLDLRPLHQQALHLARGLRGFRVRHVPREQNRQADLLANLALDGVPEGRA